MSIPANLSRVTIHLATEDEDIRLWGLTYERRSLSFPSPLKDSVLAAYACRASFGHSLLTEENEGNVKGLSSLDGRDCFDKQTGLNCTLSGSTLIAFKFKFDKLLDLDGLVRASNMTNLCDNTLITETHYHLKQQCKR